MVNAVESVHGDQDKGVRTPEEGSMEKPGICANEVVADVYMVDVE
jgi:hypothetical protein